MTTLSLVPIDADNWLDAALLKPAEDQQRFVAPNWYSLLEATRNHLLRPLVAVSGDELVGFVMYGFEPEEDDPWIYRLMVAEKHQGRGFGRQIMRQTVELIREEFPRHRVGVSYEPDNDRAARLYESLGFKHHGEVIEGETVVWLPAPDPSEVAGHVKIPLDEFLTNYLRAWREREGAVQLEVLLRVPLNPNQVQVTIRELPERSEEQPGDGKLFVQVFRRQESGGWSLANSHVETISAAPAGE